MDARPACTPACRSSTLLAASCMAEENPMTHDELVELSDLNYAEAMRDLSRRAGGAVLDEDGLLLFTGGHPLPVLANATMRTQRGLAAADVLARARAFFGARGRGFTVLVRAHADADLGDAAADAGLLAMGEMPAMVLQRRLADAVPPPGIDLRPVTTVEDVAAYGQVMGAAYATYGMPEDVLPAMLRTLDTLRAPHIIAFVARVDGKPVAGAMTVITHGVAGIYWVGTTPGARGRGLAELCTRAAGNAGFDLGARIAALQASPMGEPVYRRMGYVEVTRYPYLVQMEPPGHAA
jgi:ribosomal protein S18 acetylase RimI-like enzyme